MQINLGLSLVMQDTVTSLMLTIVARSIRIIIIATIAPITVVSIATITTVTSIVVAP